MRESLQSLDHPLIVEQSDLMPKVYRAVRIFFFCSLAML